MFDKASMVIEGPGLVKIFGQDLGTQLLPFINSGALLGLVLAPVFQFFMSNFISFDYILALGGV